MLAHFGRFWRVFAAVLCAVLFAWGRKVSLQGVPLVARAADFPETARRGASTVFENLRFADKNPGNASQHSLRQLYALSALPRSLYFRSLPTRTIMSLIPLLANELSLFDAPLFSTSLLGPQTRQQLHQLQAAMVGGAGLAAGCLSQAAVWPP